MLWIAVCDDEVMECSKIAGKIRGILEDCGQSEDTGVEVSASI